MPKEKKYLLIGILVLVYALLMVGLLAWLLGESSPFRKPGGMDTTDQTVGTNGYRPPAPTLTPNPYSAQDFEFKNGMMSFLPGKTVTGIDVSYYQKEIDWQQVADFGIQFVIVRLGYRGYETGSLSEDAMARINLQGAKDAGLQVGAYFFSQAINTEEAAAEAAFALQILDGFSLDLPLAYDWEYVSETARTANVDKETLTACTVAFCDAVRDAGYEAMVYFNPAMSQDMLDMFVLQDKGYPLWLAHFAQSMTYPHKIWLWQYSYAGKVPGIPGAVDLNIMLPQ